jgi:hypothetical protein
MAMRLWYLARIVIGGSPSAGDLILSPSKERSPAEGEGTVMTMGERMPHGVTHIATNIDG